MSTYAQIDADELLGRLSPEQADQARAVAEPERGRLAFLLWSNKHGAWWKPAARGYTVDRREAGRYTEAEAVRYVANSAMCGILSQVTCMVVDGHWGRP